MEGMARLEWIEWDGLGAAGGRGRLDFHPEKPEGPALAPGGAAAQDREAIAQALSLALGEKGALARIPDGECRAEAALEARGRLWRASLTSEKRRAGQPREVRIALSGSRPEGGWELVAEGAGPCREALRRLCGIEPERLCGAAFLRLDWAGRLLSAAPVERAALLEEVSDVAGMRSLSKRIHAESERRRRVLEAAEARAAALAVLGDEPLNALRNRAADLKRESEECRAKVRALEAALSEEKTREELQRRVDEAEAAFEQAAEQEHRFAECRERLELAKKAAAHEPALEEIRRLSESIAELRQELLEAEHERKESGLALEAKQQQALEARAGYEAASEAMREFSRVAARVVAADQRVALRSHAAGQARERLAEAKKALEARCSALEALSRGEKALLSAREGLEARCGKTQRDEALLGGLSGLGEKARRLEAAREAQALAESGEKRAASEAAAAAGRRKELERELERIRAVLGAAGERSVSAEGRLADAQGGRSLAASLEAAAAIERQLALVKALAAAKSVIVRAEADEAKARARLAEAEKASRESDQKAQQAKRSGIEMAASFARTAGERAEKLRALRFEEMPRAAEARAAALAAFGRLAAQDKALSKRFEEQGGGLERELCDERAALFAWGRKLEGESRKALEAKKAVLEAEGQMKAAGLRLREGCEAQAASQRALESAREAVRLGAASRIALEADWEQAIAPFGMKGGLLLPSQVVEQLEARRSARLELRAELEENARRLAVQRAWIADAEAGIERARRSHEEAAAQLAGALQAQEQEAAARQALFGERLLEEESSQASDRLEKAAALRDVAIERMREAEGALAQAEAVVARIEGRIKLLEASEAACESRLDTRL